MAQTQRKVTADLLTQLKSSVATVRESFLVSTIVLRTCYVENETDIKEFIDLRDKITTSMFVLKDQILPICMATLEGVISLFEYYKDLSLSDLREMVSDIADEAKLNGKKTALLAEACKGLLEDFVSIEGDCTKVIEKCKKEATELEEQSNKKKQIAGTIASVLSLASAVPIIGEIAQKLGVTITNTLTSSATNLKNQSDDKLKIAAATVMLKEDLIQAVRNFVGAMNNITELFKVFDTELNSGIEEAHCTLVKGETSSIVGELYQVIKVMPECKSNLDVLKVKRKNNGKEKEWLKEKKDQDSGSSLFEIAASLFKNQKSLKSLFDSLTENK
ncbi:hypothetical protein ABK040_012620 [Willaertia magna]